MGRELRQVAKLWAETKLVEYVHIQDAESEVSI